jgi:hypothetical protein
MNQEAYDHGAMMNAVHGLTVFVFMSVAFFVAIATFLDVRHRENHSARYFQAIIIGGIGLLILNFVKWY